MSRSYISIMQGSESERNSDLQAKANKLAEALEKMIKLYDKIGCRVCDNPDGAIFPCENCPEMYECCQVLAEYKATATPQTSAQKQH